MLNSISTESDLSHGLFLNVVSFSGTRLYISGGSGRAGNRGTLFGKEKNAPRSPLRFVDSGENRLSFFSTLGVDTTSKYVRKDK